MKSSPAGILLFSIGLLVIYFLFDTLVIAGVSKSRKAQLGKVNKICNHDQLPQLAIFGSSVSEVGMNAPLIEDQTKLSVYNFSIDGTRFMQYKGLIDEFITKNNQTKIVLLTETYFSLTQVDVLTALERYLANISNENVYRSLHSIQPELTWKCRYVPAYKYTEVSHIFYMAALDGWKNFFSKPPPDTLLGYTPKFKSWEAGEDSLLKNMQPFLIETDTAITAAYKVCIKNLQLKGIQVVIVLPPVYSAVSKKITDFTPLRNSLNKIAKEVNCRFWDFTGSTICDDKSLFYNSNHLNGIGSGVFSAVLSDSIKTLLHR
jgi:hypothetical protein